MDAEADKEKAEIKRLEKEKARHNEKVQEIDKLKLELTRMENQLDYLRELIPPRLSTPNALTIFRLILRNLRAFQFMEDRKLLFKSRLVCCLMSVIIKVSRPNEQEWIECYQQLMSLLGHDLTFLVPGLTQLQSMEVHGLSAPSAPSAPSTNHKKPVFSEHSQTHGRGLEMTSNDNVDERGHHHHHQQHHQILEGRAFYKLTGKHLVQWTVLMASHRIRWELICDLFCGSDPNTATKLHSLPKFWQSVKNAMFHHHPARFMAMNHHRLSKELHAYYNRMKDKARAQMMRIHEYEMKMNWKRRQCAGPPPIKRSQSEGSDAKSKSKMKMETADHAKLSKVASSPQDIKRSSSAGSVTE